MSKPARPVFVREATGLVREIGGVGYAMTAMNGVVPLASLVLTPWWIWFAAPTADMFTSCLLGFLFSICGVVPAYAMLCATFPRSAAPYVANSRVLHPAVGWPAEVLQWVAVITGFALLPSFMITWALIPGLYTMGVSMGNKSLIAAAFWLTNPGPDVLVGLIFFACALPIALVHTRRLVMTFQLPMTIIMFVVIGVIMWIFATSSTAQVSAVLPKYLGTTYNAVLSNAQTSYPAAMSPVVFSFFPLWAATAFTAGSFNTYFSAWASGEVKRAGQVKMQVFAMIVPSALTFVVVAGTVLVAQANLGRNFLVAMTQILSLNPSFFSIAPPMAGYPILLLPMIIADNPVLQFVIMIGVIAATECYLPATWLMVSREWFAWSFDRIMPAKFAEVSDRWHTPIWSVIGNFIAGLIFLVIFTYFIQYLGFFLTASWDMAFVPSTLVSIAAIVIPLRKDLWNLSPIKKYNLAGVPLISIVGIISLAYELSAMIVYTITPILGFGLPNTLMVVTGFVIPFILYWIVRYIRQRQGISLGIVFATIPPE